MGTVTRFRKRDSFERSRAAACAAVIALHAGLLITLGVALRTADRRSPAAELISTLILLPAPPVRSPPAAKQRPTFLGEQIPLDSVEPPTLPPPETPLPITPGTSVDWAAEAGRAAAAVTEAKKFREFGHRSAQSGSQPRTPAHQAGEQYRLETGEWVVWVSDRCYIVSGAPPLGMPDVIARSIPAHTVCRDDSAAQGELFKDLPAYQKYPH